MPPPTPGRTRGRVWGRESAQHPAHTLSYPSNNLICSDAERERDWSRLHIAQVKASTLPPELLHTTPDTGLPIPVNISLSDRRPTPYPGDKASARAFAGAGQTLGGTAAAPPTAAAGDLNGEPPLGLAWLASLWTYLWRRVWGCWSHYMTAPGAATHRGTAANPLPVMGEYAATPTTD